MIQSRLQFLLFAILTAFLSVMHHQLVLSWLPLLLQNDYQQQMKLHASLFICGERAYFFLQSLVVDSSLWIFCVSASLVNNWIPLLYCLFENTCIVNSFGRQGSCLPPEQKAGLFTAQYNKDNKSLQGKVWAHLLHSMKDLGSLCLGFLCYNAATMCAGIIQSCSTLTMELHFGEQGKC